MSHCQYYYNIPANEINIKLIINISKVQVSAILSLY